MSAGVIYKVVSTPRRAKLHIFLGVAACLVLAAIPIGYQIHLNLWSRGRIESKLQYLPNTCEGMSEIKKKFNIELELKTIVRDRMFTYVTLTFLFVC